MRRKVLLNFSGEKSIFIVLCGGKTMVYSIHGSMWVTTMQNIYVREKTLLNIALCEKTMLNGSVWEESMLNGSVWKSYAEWFCLEKLC